MNSLTQLETDANRNIWTILGLPLDAMNMNAAVERIYHAIDKKQRCFISTPNLNFLVASQTNQLFRKSVINSDLCLVDGAPLIWIAKLLRIPLREKVTGSGLFEMLMHTKARATNPVKVFFFGGQENVAKQACENLQQQQPCGIESAGFLDPGFVSVEEMSQPHIIETINRSGAEFIVVALGAEKGQAWIERNRERLSAPVISHLGAVINFVAGTVARAPLSWQHRNFEWLWRIKEEPALWKRYFFDGLVFLKLLLTTVLPYALIVYLNRKNSGDVDTASISVREGTREAIIGIDGIMVAENLQPLRDIFMDLLHKSDNINIELDNVEYADASFVGLLLVWYKHVGERLIITNPSPLVRRIFDYNGASFLLVDDYERRRLSAGQSKYISLAISRGFQH